MPNPPPPLPSNSVMLDKWVGLRNTVDPERLQPDELVRARNVNVDDRGQLHRRRGTALLNAGAWHSLTTTAKGTVLGVKNGVFGRVNPDFTFMGFGGLSTVGTAPLAYVQVGDVMYFSSRDVSGQINLKAIPAVVTQWGALGGDGFWYSPVVHPDNAVLIPAQTGGFEAVRDAAEGITDPTLPLIGGKLLGYPPLATSLTYWNGRIYLANGTTLWATELYLYNYVDRTKNFRQFESDITMLATVQDGIYVGTKSNLWFISGAFHESQAVLVAAGGVVPGSATYVEEHLVSPQTQMGHSDLVETKQAVVVLSDSSMLVCLAGGQVFDLTRDKYILPPAVSSAVLFRQTDGINQVIASQDSGGQPVENARVGDYLSATLVRNGVIVP